MISNYAIPEAKTEGIHTPDIKTVDDWIAFTLHPLIKPSLALKLSVFKLIQHQLADSISSIETLEHLLNSICTFELQIGFRTVRFDRTGDDFLKLIGAERIAKIVANRSDLITVLTILPSSWAILILENLSVDRIRLFVKTGDDFCRVLSVYPETKRYEFLTAFGLGSIQKLEWMPHQIIDFLNLINGPQLFSFFTELGGIEFIKATKQDIFSILFITKLLPEYGNTLLKNLGAEYLRQTIRNIGDLAVLLKDCHLVSTTRTLFLDMLGIEYVRSIALDEGGSCLYNLLEDIPENRRYVALTTLWNDFLREQISNPIGIKIIFRFLPTSYWQDFFNFLGIDHLHHIIQSSENLALTLKDLPSLSSDLFLTIIGNDHVKNITENKELKSISPTDSAEPCSSESTSLVRMFKPKTATTEPSCAIDHISREMKKR